VVEAVAPNRADQAFGERILPRTSSSREDFLNPHTLHALSEGVAVDGVSIAQEVGRGRVVREGVHDLLSGPRRGGMLGDVEVQDPAAMVSEDDQDEEHPQLSGGHGKKSIETRSWTWFVRNVRQVCEGGVGRFGMRRETVRSATSNPSLRSSPWIRGAPHSGLAAAILRTSAMISAFVDGRPT
jgi:hypothetical protein